MGSAVMCTTKILVGRDHLQLYTLHLPARYLLPPLIYNFVVVCKVISVVSE